MANNYPTPEDASLPTPNIIVSTTDDTENASRSVYVGNTAAIVDRLRREGYIVDSYLDFRDNIGTSGDYKYLDTYGHALYGNPDNIATNAPVDEIMRIAREANTEAEAYQEDPVAPRTPQTREGPVRRPM